MRNHEQELLSERTLQFQHTCCCATIAPASITYCRKACMHGGKKHTEISEHLVHNIEWVVHETLVVHNTHVLQRYMLRPCFQHRCIHTQSCTGSIWWEYDVDIISLVSPAFHTGSAHFLIRGSTPSSTKYWTVLNIELVPTALKNAPTRSGDSDTENQYLVLYSSSWLHSRRSFVPTSRSLVKSL